MQDYSLSQIKSMQSQAAERVRQMHQKAKAKVEQHNDSIRSESTAPVKSDENSVLPPVGQIDLKKIIFSDSDRTLLIALILILSESGECDQMLIMALVYIML